MKDRGKYRSEGGQEEEDVSSYSKTFR